MGISIQDFEERLYKEVGFLNGNGKDKAINFLVWFLINFYRIEEELACDLVCDHTNDKGIDGIYVDNQSKEIILLQSKFREKFCKGEGDSDLRKFIGSGEWFSLENLENLESSRAAKELKSLVSDLKVFELLSSGYTLKQLFVTTGYFDSSAKDYVKITKDKVEYWDCNILYSNFTFNGSEELVQNKFTFKPTDKVVEIKYDPQYSAFLFSIKASELLKLDGIVDRSLFSKNVRYGLGRTNVNKSITDTIKTPSKHKDFILFHNGITIVCHKAKLVNNQTDLEISNYSIVNGCQSTLTLYENRNYISDYLELMIKVVATGENTKLSDDITYFANNQNPINPADLKSREKFQLDLQQQFFDFYGPDVHYKIKRGEPITAKTVIENTLAAQLLYSFVVESPFNAHLKTSTFAKQYDKIFTRHTDIHLIFFLNQMFDLIQENIELIKEPIVRTYQPTKFFILFMIKRIISESDVSIDFNKSVHDFMINNFDKYIPAFNKLIKILIVQLNSDLDNLREDDGYIDYKNVLRNATEGRKLSNSIIKGYNVLLIHNTENKLSELLKK